MFEVDIVSDPSLAHSTAGSILNEHYGMVTSYDESLVKPALLVADKVRLITMRKDLIQFETAEAYENSRMPLRYTMAFARLSLRPRRDDLLALGFTEGDFADVNDATNLLTAADIRVALLSFAQKYNDQITNYQTIYDAVLRKRVTDLQSPGIEKAKAAGLLDEIAWYDGGEISIDALVWNEGVGRYLTDAVIGVAERIIGSHGSVLLEPGAIRILNSADSRAPKAAQKKPELDLAAGVATAVTGRLPGLSDMPFDEVLDLRDDLEDYLAPFRGAMAELADEIASAGKGSTDLVSEVERQWVRKIDPTLSEMRAAIGRGSYRRNLLGTFAEDKAALASSGSSIALGVGSIFAGFGALIPSGVTAAFPFVRALNETLKARDDVRKNRLYFLYRARSRAGRYA
jgi:hypothetical protein